MKLLIPSLKIDERFYSQLFLIFLFCLILIAFATKEYYVLFFPLLIGFFFVLIFVPESIPYFLIISNFYGGFLFLKSKIAVTVTDVFFLIVVLAYFGYLFSRNYKKNYYLKPQSKRIFTLLIFFFIISLISFLFNIYILKIKFILISIWYLIKLLQLVLVFFIFSNINFSKEQIERFINLCLFLSLLQLPIVVYQYYVVYSNEILKIRNLIHGTFTYHHSMLGTFMLIPLSFCMYRFLGIETTAKRFWYLILGIGCLLIIIISGCRSALFGVVISSIIFFFMNFRIKKLHFLYIFSTLLVGFVLYLYSPLGEIVQVTFFSKETKFLDISSASRFIIWEGGIKHFLSANIGQKLFGVGLGAYPTIMYDIVIWGSRSASGAHNNLLHVLSEVGIFGLCIFICLFYTILKELYKHSTNLLSRVYFYVTIALLASSITQETFWFQKAFGSFWLFYMLFLAIILQNNQKVEK